jgi:hypothetical protein
MLRVVVEADQIAAALDRHRLVEGRIGQRQAVARADMTVSLIFLVLIWYIQIFYILFFNICIWIFNY